MTEPQATERKADRAYDSKAYVKEVAKQLTEGGFEIAHFPDSGTPYLVHRFTGLTLTALEDTTQIRYPAGYGGQGEALVELTRATNVYAVADAVAALTKRLEDRRRAPVIPRGSHIRQW
ncbi:hypothetical protein BS329_38910 [Amycolatopsis coloradensis]|uniref:Uncharacterized protein n=1 Tax=Amycolatopsis coloradensis TaxID=76021 RepID=A0A1R0KET0_9PSEU|nr:hypothetical protein [Amycolatopsis coloradensis]OLZ43631.1 hypothetical protein BS329_38910 [Amycolatopsis coloradensis]